MKRLVCPQCGNNEINSTTNEYCSSGGYNSVSSWNYYKCNEGHEFTITYDDYRNTDNGIYEEYNIIEPIEGTQKYVEVKEGTLDIVSEATLPSIRELTDKLNEIIDYINEGE